MPRNVAFVIEKYQGCITELATFKNYRPEVSILYEHQLGFYFAHNSKQLNNLRNVF